MSYRYGTNGNDLNWESVDSLYQYCLTCEEFVYELKQKIKNVIEEYFGCIDDWLINNFVDDLMETHSVCEGHVWVYSPIEINFEKLLKEGKTIESTVPWCIYHDTNSNFVELYGEVPDEYLTEEYIKERDEYLKK